MLDGFGGKDFGHGRRDDGWGERRGRREAFERRLRAVQVQEVGLGDDAGPEPIVDMSHDEEDLFLMRDAEILQQDRIDD